MDSIGSNRVGGVGSGLDGQIGRFGKLARCGRVCRAGLVDRIGSSRVGSGRVGRLGRSRWLGRDRVTGSRLPPPTRTTALSRSVSTFAGAISPVRRNDSLLGSRSSPLGEKRGAASHEMLRQRLQVLYASEVGEHPRQRQPEVQLPNVFHKHSPRQRQKIFSRPERPILGMRGLLTGLKSSRLNAKW